MPIGLIASVGGVRWLLAALGEIAATITQTGAAVSDLSAHAETGNRLARTTADLALDGRRKQEWPASEIECIAKRQGGIDRITVAITRIADKTQVLSINAGIEAARVEFPFDAIHVVFMLNAA